MEINDEMLTAFASQTDDAFSNGPVLPFICRARMFVKRDS